MKNKNILILFVAVLIMSACTKTEEHDFGGKEDKEVMLRLSVKPEKDWTGINSSSETRAPSTAIEQVVKDLWVFQFDGTNENTSTLVSPPKYVDIESLALGEAIPFVNSGVATHNIVVIANTGNSNFTWSAEVGVTTLADLKETSVTIEQESDMFPNGGILMYGNLATQINSSTAANLNITLSYPMARIKLVLKCTTSDINVSSIRFGNVTSHLDLFGKKDASANYPDGEVDYFFYDELSVSGINATEQTFVWYVPQNLRGVANQSTSIRTKNTFAPSLATYFTIYAEDITTNTPVLYTFYPGEDMIKDFNIKSGNSYNFSIDIKGRDNALVDSRIDDLSVISYEGDPANSYILNPPRSGNVTYRIFPTQVDKFWGQRYENVPDNMLGDDVAWKIKLLWMDEDGLVKTTNDAITISKDNGVGVNDWFDVTVPPGSKYGNFVLAIYKASDASETPLWSWHFWVTEYNPDVSKLQPVKGRYVYNVENGTVVRLTRSAGTKGPDQWAEGAVYGNSFIMDRYIGERVIDRVYDNNPSVAEKTQGNLHYQWGRKDPFPVYTGLTDITGATVALTGSGTINSMGDAVNNPVLYTRLNINSRSNYIWADTHLPIVGISNPTDHEYNNTAKSLYDPCPPGWQLPNTNTFSDFVRGKTMDNSDRGLDDYISSLVAVRYWPYIEKNGMYPVGGTIRFIMAMSREGLTSVRYNKGGFWTNYSFNKITVATDYNNGQEGQSVGGDVNARCISSPK